ncbi:MAG: hypothetical protein WA977_09995 [Halobacteriota archaeon]
MPYNFVKEVRKLEGIVDDVNVWVTNEIASQFIPREKVRETPEVHVAGLCIKNENDKITALIARRNKDRALFPGLYEGCGGAARIFGILCQWCEKALLFRDAYRR